MATKKLGKLNTSNAPIKEAFVDGDTLQDFIELGKKVGITTVGDFVQFGELYKGEKDISITQALQKYCKMKGIKTDLGEAITQPLKEEETFLSAEDMMDAYWVFTTYLEEAGYSNKDRMSTVADELSKPKYTEKKQKALDAYKAAVKAANGDTDKLQKAKEKYLNTIKEITENAANAVRWIGYWNDQTKDNTCSVAVHSFDKDSLKTAIDLADEAGMYLSDIYETKVQNGKLSTILYSVDFDPETVDTQDEKWIDFVQAHVKPGQLKAYGTKRFDKQRAEIAAANAAGETLPAHHETSDYETKQIRKRFDKFRAEKRARGEEVTDQDYFADEHNKVALDDTFDDLRKEVAISDDEYPEDDFAWGEDDK